MKHIRNVLMTIFILLFVGVSAWVIQNELEFKQYQKVHPVQEQCRNFQDAINVYKTLYGSYPSGSNALASIIKDEDCRKLLKNTNLDDPWGTPFRFKIIGGHPVVDSAGEDRKFDTPDDIHSF
jgi:hypothetical protein